MPESAFKVFRYKSFIAILISALFFSMSFLNSRAYAEKREILFNIGPDGYPPYMIKKENRPPSGIMVDVLEVIAKKYGYSVIETSIPRKRVEHWLYSGKIDVTPRAREWTENPDSFVFTDPVVQCREVIFVRKGTGLSKLEDLQGRRLGTRLGYFHKELEPYFKDKRIIRENAPNEWAMFKMLQTGRVDAVSCVELVGLWTIRENRWYGEFVTFKKEVSNTGYRLMFSTKWAPFVKLFNRELDEMKKNGELERILSRYR